jgi:molybdate transport system substrate-binding protein
VSKRFHKISSWLIGLILLITLLPLSTLLGAPPSQAAACAEVYTVQAEDWLSKIADKFLGNMLAYPAIYVATNQQHAADPTFALIGNPDLLEVGWQLCIPTGEQAETLLTKTQAEPEAVTLASADLTVFAAASLTEAFTEIGQNFETAYPGVDVTFNFAGSQQLAQQLDQGAPADVFASANTTQMGIASESGRVDSNTQQLFARNQLVVVYPIDNSTRLRDLSDLAQPNLKLILAAGEVPVGQYSIDFLDKAAADPGYGTDFKAAVLNNVVSYEQNVKAVLTKVALGEGDAGLVYTSDVNPDIASQVGQIEIPANLNTVAAYPIAVVSDSPNPTQAQAFIDYVAGPEGQQILARFGFMPASE